MTLTIVYSFNKRGSEAEFWEREIGAASDGRYRFIPFNHDRYLPWTTYRRAQLLDNLYFDKHPGLMQMYADLRKLLASSAAEALLVDNCFPYHPDWLRDVDVYKVLRTTDGPLAAYDRDIPYVHAYDHVLYHSPAHSPRMSMREKLVYCGAHRSDFWPLALFDRNFDPSKDESSILAAERDIDVIFIGAIMRNKMPLLAAVKKAFGRRAYFAGRNDWRLNAYFNAKYGFPGWFRPVSFDDYVRLYQRAKIGISVHNRGAYTVGSFRMFDLPANGVMQISDGGEYLQDFFDVGREIVGYDSVGDLIEKIHYYLANDEERREIALAGYRRTMRDHRIGFRLRQGAELIERGLRGKAMERTRPRR
ncbi:MAG TPA: glycosyltransferase [Thermoanaerobaculia bacterium]|nr:glycosyltransferase [Thermoanaerobaculia bacterium]